MTTESQRAKVLTEAELDELERLHSQAFRAPWTYSRWEVECPTCEGSGNDPDSADNCPEPDCEGGDTKNVTIESPEEYPDGQIVAQFSVPGLLSLADKNGALIVALRNAAPRLIASARSATSARRTGEIAGVERAIAFLREPHRGHILAAGLLESLKSELEQSR